MRATLPKGDPELRLPYGGKKIKLGFSPDSDDAFMFWGLATGVVETKDDCEHILRDIKTLNEWAMEGRRA